MQWLAAFDQVRLVEIRRAGEVRRRAAAAGRDWRLLLALELEKILGPSKTARAAYFFFFFFFKLSVTQIPEIERAIALGVELLQLRSTMCSNTQFGHVVKSRFGVEQKHASEIMRVARLYASRPEIHRTVSWRTLVKLSSPMSAAARQHLEARILAGDQIGAPDVLRVRQAHARQPDQPEWRRSSRRTESCTRHLGGRPQLTG